MNSELLTFIRAAAIWKTQTERALSALGTHYTKISYARVEFEIYSNPKFFLIPSIVNADGPISALNRWITTSSHQTSYLLGVHAVIARIYTWIHANESRLIADLELPEKKRDFEPRSVRTQTRRGSEFHEGYRQAWASLDQLVKTLRSPETKQTLFNAQVFNPEAGYSAVIQEPHLIQCALRAGDLAWRRFPYLRLRFGERGRRYTRSDSCWLLYVAGLGEPLVRSQLEWLRGVLEVRGLPSIILETHLQELARALRKIQEIERAHQLSKIAEQWMRGRTATLGRLSLDPFVFDANWSIEFPVKGLPELYACAASDDVQAGRGALAALRHWAEGEPSFTTEHLTTLDHIFSEDRLSFNRKPNRAPNQDR